MQLEIIGVGNALATGWLRTLSIARLLEPMAMPWIHMALNHGKPSQAHSR